MRSACVKVPKRFQSPGTSGFARCDSGIRLNMSKNLKTRFSLDMFKRIQAVEPFSSHQRALVVLGGWIQKFI